MEEKEKIYAILKRIEADQPVNQEVMELEAGAFADIMEELIDSRMVENVKISRSGNGMVTVRATEIKMTRRGLDFILLKESGRI
ncbi:YjcQ family protein [Paenibacillus sp. FSL K6-1217]|uniref:YjcQ family protein n=1 Tax=Paenibacillus sp. FSL K6-1217 TaxID=2921466 RepID=UPI00324F2A83